MSFKLTVTFAQCHIKAPYTECHYAEHGYAECRYAECRYAECCGVISYVKKRLRTLLWILPFKHSSCRMCLKIKLKNGIVF